MPHTRDAIVYDPNTLIMQMIIIPDDDDELRDPAFNPPGMAQLHVDRLDADAQDPLPKVDDQPVAVARAIIDRAVAAAASLGVALRPSAEVADAKPVDASPVDDAGAQEAVP